MNKTVLILLVTSSWILLCNNRIKAEEPQSSPQLQPATHEALSKILGLDLNSQRLNLPSIRVGNIDGIGETESYEGKQQSEISVLNSDDNEISFGGLIWIFLKNIFSAVINFVIGNYIAIIWNVFYIVEAILKFVLGFFA